MKRLPGLIFFTLVSLSSFAMEVREGRLKLVIQDASGRFSLYYLTDIQKDRYEPLFVDKDPRTSFTSLLIDDRSHRLGDSTSFRVKTERTEGGARIVFDSATLVATQTFSFARLSGAALADALRIDFTLVNKSDRELNVGLRFVLDTNLAEKKPSHFRTDKKEIASETLLETKTDSDSWWTTDDEKVGLMGSISVQGFKAPDSIYFANWKRQNDTPWKTQPSPGRNFNLLPYSIGDSALSYYFENEPLARGAERKNTLFLGAANPKGFEGIGDVASDSLSKIVQTSVEAAGAPDLALQTDLITVRDLLARIDILLKSPTGASDEEIAALEAVIVRLKERNQIK